MTRAEHAIGALCAKYLLPPHHDGAVFADQILRLSWREFPIRASFQKPSSIWFRVGPAECEFVWEEAHAKPLLRAACARLLKIASEHEGTRCNPYGGEHRLQCTDESGQRVIITMNVTNTPSCQQFRLMSDPSGGLHEST